MAALTSLFANSREEQSSTDFTVAIGPVGLHPAALNLCF